MVPASGSWGTAAPAVRSTRRSWRGRDSRWPPSPTANPERAAQVREDLPGATVVARPRRPARDGRDRPRRARLAERRPRRPGGRGRGRRATGRRRQAARRRRHVGVGGGRRRRPRGCPPDGVPEPPLRPGVPHAGARSSSDGLVGQVVRAELRWERWRPVPKQRWRENAPPEEGGGLLLDLYPHLVDQAHLLFGPIETVYAELSSLTTVSEDTAFLSCRHTSGVVSHLGSTALAAAPGPWLRLLGPRGRLRRRRPERGADRVHRVAARPTRTISAWLVRSDGEREAVPRVPGDQADFYREVAQALAQPDPQAAMPVDPRDSVHALAVIDAARTSAQSGSGGRGRHAGRGPLTCAPVDNSAGGRSTRSATMAE